MNKVILKGRLGSNPENNKGVVKFSLATNDGTKEKPQTNWHNIVSFGKTAEVLEKYLKKGDEVLIEGTISYYKKEDKTYTSILVNGFDFIGGAKSEQKTESTSTPPQSTPPQNDDLPF